MRDSPAQYRSIAVPSPVIATQEIDREVRA